MPAFAQGESAAVPPPPDAGNRPVREELLKRFDANRDGKLDDAERATAHAEWQKRTAGHDGPEGFRGPGGPGGPRGAREFAGRGGRGEDFRGRGGHHHRHWRKMMRLRHTRRMHVRQAMLHRFDQDGDRHLSEAERGDVRKAGGEMRARFQEGRKQLVERFDANHDGKLDENERKGARDAWQEFLKQRPVLTPAPAGK